MCCTSWAQMHCRLQSPFKQIFGCGSACVRNNQHAITSPAPSPILFNSEIWCNKTGVCHYKMPLQLYDLPLCRHKQTRSTNTADIHHWIQYILQSGNLYECKPATRIAVAVVMHSDIQQNDIKVCTKLGTLSVCFSHPPHGNWAWPSLPQSAQLQRWESCPSATPRWR